MRARPTIAFIAVTSALVFGAAIAPASAATTTVTTIGGFTTALADCSSAPNTIVIGADIVDANSTLSVPCDTTIDLTTNDLTLMTLNIATGVELEITGPTDGTEGVLTTNASGTAQAAIRTTGATLRVTGGAIHATGGFYGTIGGDLRASGGTFIVEDGTVTAISNAVYGSAIGGANGAGQPGGDGGVITISGGSVTAITNSSYGVAIGSGAGTPGGAGAAISVTGGILTATGTGNYAATIGGGNVYSGATGSAGTLTIGAGGTVVVSSSGGGAATVFGAGPAALGEPLGAPGTLVVDGDLFIPAGVLRMPTGTSVTVGATGRILGSEATPASGASFVGPATITNNGIIALSPDPALVTGNNRALTYSDSSPSTRVFAPSLGAGFRSLATPPTGTAWNTAADGSGTWFDATTSTSDSGTTPLFALVPGSIVVSTDPADLVATAGETFTFPVTVLDALGDPVSPQPAVTFTSSNCTFTGMAVFETAGPCSITANSTLVIPLETEFDITVEAAAAASLAISPATASVDAGSAATFTVTAADEFGNPTSAAGAELSSSVPGDGISGLSVTPSTVGDRTIAASLGSAGTAVPATLTATMPVVQWDAPDLDATAGVSVALDAIVEDAGGTPFSPQPSITYTSTCAFTGLAVFTAAGVCPVTASATLFGQPVSTEFDVTVSAAVAAALTIAPGTTSVDAGTPATFTVTAVDAYGNPTSAAGAVLSTDVGGNIISGWSVTPMTLGDREVSASLGSASTAVPATMSVTMPTVTWDAPDLTATAGVPVPLNAVVEDGSGTPFSPQPTITYTSTCTISGTDVFSTAGICPVTASATLYGQPINTEFDVTVSAAAAATLEITPTATSVPQGGSVTFTVTGEDEFGNPVDTADVVLTSSVATDVVSGRTVSFPTASPHTITATLGAASASVTIEVVAPAAAGIQSTGSTLGALALPLAGLAALLLVIGALVMIARRRAA